MAFNINNPTHVSLLIDRVRESAIALETIRLQLMELNTLIDTNGVATQLSAPGAAFPAGFSLTPAVVQSAQNALTNVVRTAITTAITPGQQANMDRLRLDFGVLTGGG